VADMKSERVGGFVFLTPEGGHLDASNRDEFRVSLEAAAKDAASEGLHSLVLDLSNVRFVDSSGLGVIMTALRHIRGSGGDMVACNIMKQVKVLFDLIRLDRVMSVYDDRTAAAAGFTVRKDAPPAS
jgi:anti-sigma B factor antagonist